MFRDRKVGRIWKYDYTGKVSGEMARWLWHWDWRDVDGRKVGRIWKYDYTGKVSGEMARWLWHWDWRSVDGRKDAEGHCGSLEPAFPG